jgi:FAD/FMN-containing dehydrogenase
VRGREGETPHRVLTRREFTQGLAVAALVPPGWALVSRRHPAALRQLARECRGPVLAPGDAGFGAVAHGYDERYDGRVPQAVLLAEGVGDVQAAVRWAARHGVRIAARSGGHSYAGYSTPAGGLVVDLRRMRRIVRHHANTRVVAGPGVQLGDLYAALAPHGVTVPAGTCPSVALGGHAQGGGMGLAGRDLGLTCDHVEQLTIVTANGRARVANARRESDLYWACRGGGGGNFGIVTSFTLRTAPAHPAAWFFVRWPWSQASAALAAWQGFAPEAPEALTSVFTLATGGQVTALGQYRGSLAQMRRLLGPLTRVSGASLSSGVDGWLALQRRWAGCAHLSGAECHTVGTRPGGTLPRADFAGGSDYFARRLPSAGRAAAIRALGRRSSGSAALLFDAYGGAINRVRPGATAFVHRDQRCSVQYLAYGAAGPAAAWVRGARGSLAPWVSGEAYQNYIDPDLAHWRRAYYGANLARLESVKHAVDPDRVFRFAQAI